MSEQKKNFGDKTISKTDFYSSMQAISQDSVDNTKVIDVTSKFLLDT